MDAFHARAAVIILIGGIVAAMSATHSAHARGSQACGLTDVRYEIIDIDADSPSSGSTRALNDRGQVVGASYERFGAERFDRAYVWDCATGKTIIGALRDEDFASEAIDINNKGEVIGLSGLPFDRPPSFIWSRRAGMREITFEGLPTTILDINNRSDLLFQAAGQLRLRDRTGRTYALSDLLGFQPEFLVGFNNLGIVGGARRVGSTFRFFDWSRTRGLRDRGPAPGSTSHISAGMSNERGDLYGTIQESSGAFFPFYLDRAGELQVMLDNPRGGYGASSSQLNNRRQAVGVFAEGEESRAYYWDPINGPRDFQDFVNGPHIAFNLTDINEWGWVSGEIAIEGVGAHAALFVPVPTRHNRYANLGKLRGQRLCRALDAIKIEAALSCLLSK